MACNNNKYFAGLTLIETKCLDQFILIFLQTIQSAQWAFTRKSLVGNSKNGMAPWNIGWSRLGDEKEPGINGGLTRKGESGMPNMNTVSVSSVDEFSKKITDKGGKILIPKMAIPSIGWFATCQDTEGNTFGIMQNDPSAK